MSNENKKSTTTTSTTTLTSRDLLDRLSPEEERVLRARHGIKAKPSEELRLQGQGNAEVRAQLAMLEQQAIEAMRRGPAPRREPEVDGPRKREILERLAKRRRE